MDSLGSPNDIETVRALTEAAYRPYVDLLGARAGPVTEDYVPRIEAGEVRLVEVSGTVAGLLVLERHTNHAMIYSVAVFPAFQGKGHGVALIRLAEHEARAWKLPELRLFTNILMTRNIALYAALGFRETARRPHPRRPGLHIVDMAQPLG